MKRIPIEENELTVKDLVHLATREVVIVTRKGKPLISVNSVTGSDWESLSLANNPEFQAILSDSWRSYQEEGGIPLEQVRKELGLKPVKSRKRVQRRKKTRTGR